MAAEPTCSELETRFLALFEQAPLPIDDLLPLIQRATTCFGEEKAGEWTMMLIQELTDAGAFESLYRVLRARASRLSAMLAPEAVGKLFKNVNHYRLVTAFLDAASFGKFPLEESFTRMDTLLSLTPGVQVIDSSWGFGVIVSADAFQQSFTIDFTHKPHHILPFSTATETVRIAPTEHLLSLRHNDPEAINRLITEAPSELVRRALASFGNMTVLQLETLLVREAFIQQTEWKRVWEGARKGLKSDPLVNVPTKRNEPIRLLAQAETYGDDWFDALARNSNPGQVLEQIIELESAGKVAGLDDAARGVLEERLGFAIKAAQGHNPALYARLAVMVSNLSFLTPPADQLRAHLWDQHRFIAAAESLTVKEVAGLATFLLAEGGAVNRRLATLLPQMPFNLLNEVLTLLKEDAAIAERCCGLLSQPKAPATLVSWIFRNRAIITWPIPKLGALLNHAILIVESRLSGEALRMQNHLKKLFGQAKWLDDIFAELDEPERQRFFERVQASAAWDPSTHRALLNRMLKLDPALATRKRSVSQPVDTTRWTSWRSLTERQLLYKRMIEVELPKNSQDIATARSYGDLRENFEYQAAKDYQRQLLQRQAEIQQDLADVKGSSFVDVPFEIVAPGTRITLCYEDGSKQTYTILGEWDRDETLNIISNRTRLAHCLLGKQAGDRVQVPASTGEVSALIEAVLPLDDAIRDWIKSNPDSKPVV